eukprot:NODE_542_length_6882_cov_0.127967.p2 type:complete len:301 gc:universal NODE_542_length_6882_cov_0.127967:5174-6076(+)
MSKVRPFLTKFELFDDINSIKLTKPDRVYLQNHWSDLDEFIRKMTIKLKDTNTYIAKTERHIMSGVIYLSVICGINDYSKIKHVIEILAKSCRKEKLNRSSRDEICHILEHYLENALSNRMNNLHLQVNVDEFDKFIKGSGGIDNKLYDELRKVGIWRASVDLHAKKLNLYGSLSETEFKKKCIDLIPEKYVSYSCKRMPKNIKDEIEHALDSEVIRSSNSDCKHAIYDEISDIAMIPIPKSVNHSNVFRICQFDVPRPVSNNKAVVLKSGKSSGITEGYCESDSTVDFSGYKDLTSVRG